MDTSNTLSFDESEFEQLFKEAGLADFPEPNMERVKKVIERSLHEKAIKDTASFVFQGFPVAMMGLLAIATNSVGDDNSDYRT